MRNIGIVFKRELAGYFATPLAFVFLVIFLATNGWLTFYLMRFYEANQATLAAFFYWHPWLYLFLLPALGMHLWSEERGSGTIELLMTLPISLKEAVIGKFLAAWTFAGIALSLTLPMWITVNILGSPDNGSIFAGYIGSWLMAGGFLAIASCISATTRNQVIAFIVSVVVSFLFLLLGLEPALEFVRGVLPQAIVDIVASFSFLTHFEAISKGVIDLRDLIYFGALIAAWLAANIIVLDMKKAD